MSFSVNDSMIFHWCGQWRNVKIIWRAAGWPTSQTVTCFLSEIGARPWRNTWWCIFLAQRRRIGPCARWKSNANRVLKDHCYVRVRWISPRRESLTYIDYFTFRFRRTISQCNCEIKADLRQAPAIFLPAGRTRASKGQASALQRCSTKAFVPADDI